MVWGTFDVLLAQNGAQTVESDLELAGSGCSRLWTNGAIRRIRFGSRSPGWSRCRAVCTAVGQRDRSGNPRAASDLGSANVTASPNPAPGWYPDPLNPGKRIYWDGSTWGELVGMADKLTTTKNGGRHWRLCSRASRSGDVYAIGEPSVWLSSRVDRCRGGCSRDSCGVFHGAATWVRAVAALLLAVALLNAFYIESQLSEKRDELTRVFDQ